MDTDTLAALIRRKHDSLVQLDALGKRQLQLVEDGDMTALLDLLAVKQGILSELQRMEIALGPFRGQSPQERRWRSAADRDRAAAELDECERLLGRIVAREKQSEEILVRRRNETAIRLQEVHCASQARGAYVGHPARGYSQINLTSDH
jgi:hypothetical protein